MATNYGTAQIIQNGLVFTLDPASQRSWSGPNSNSVTDIIGGNVGTINGDTSGSYGINKSFEFDGGSANYDKIIFSSPSELGFGTDPFTISLWSRTINYDQSYPYLIDFRTALDTTNLNFYFERHSNTNEAGIEVHLGSTVINGATGTAVPEGVWKYVTVTRSGNTFTTYINGVADQTGTTSNSISAPNQLRIGERYTSTYYPMDGYIGPIHMYNRALTAEEILKNYNALKGRFA